MVVPLLSFCHSLAEATQHEHSVFNRKYWLCYHIPWEIDPHIQITRYLFHCRKPSQSMHLFPFSGAAHSILFSKYWSASLDYVKNGNNQSISYCWAIPDPLRQTRWGISGAEWTRSNQMSSTSQSAWEFITFHRREAIKFKKNTVMKPSIMGYWLYHICPFISNY